MNLLTKPFPAFREPKQVVQSAILFGLFVALFLGVFKPFGLEGLGENLLLIATGYGVITSVCMLMIQWLTPVLFPNFYREEHWTTGREIVQTMANIVLIAVGNWIYSWALGFFDASWYTFIVFLGFTIAVGIIPVSIQVLIRQNSYQRKYSKSSDAINLQIAERTADAHDSRTIQISDENGKIVLETFPEKIIAAESADNYVKIYSLADNGASNEMIRSTLAALEDMLANDPRFFRTHRSWLVNLGRIEKVSGNARGYTLRLDGFQSEIPVARSRIAAFDEAMSKF